MRLSALRSSVSQDLLYKVAYDEAVRALSEQQGVIDSLRARAGLLLSTAAVTTSFLGPQALHGGSLSFFSWLALTGFVGVATASLAILWPRRWEVGPDPREVIDVYVGDVEPVPAEELYRELSLLVHESYLGNREGLERLVVFFQIASGLLTVEVALWIIAIILVL
jgi:hypothetical protein